MADRNERVILSLVDRGFSTGMQKAAGQAALLERSLESLDGQTVNIDTDVNNLGSSFRKASSDLDSFSGRVGLAAKAVATLGPALVPLGTVAVAGVAGLSNQLGFMAVAAGTAVLAFQGVGDAMEAVNKAALEPTTENLAAAQKALAALSPAAQSLVGQLQSMKPLLTELRDTAAAGMFPGLVDGLQSLERVAPQVERVIDAVSRSLGELFAAAGGDLASGRWDDFFSMLAREARPTLMDLGGAIGDVAHGFSELWQAFAPINREFSGWLRGAARDFSRWSEGLSQTDGFQDFVDYLRTNGPKVAEAAGAIGNALVQIVQAAAPLGGPTLDAITKIAEAIALLADSPLGTPLLTAASAMSALSLAARGLSTSLAAVGVSGGAAATGLASVKSAIGPTAAAIAASTLAVDAMGGAYEKWLALDVSGAAAGNADALEDVVGHMHLLESNTGAVLEGMNEVYTGYGLFGDTLQDKAVKDIEAFDQALADMVGSGQAEQAAQIFDALTSGAESIGIDASKYFEKYETAVEGAGKSTEGTSEALRNLAAASANVKTPLEDAKAALRGVREDARQTASSFFDLTTSMEPKKFDLGKWIDQLAQQAQALRNFRLNAERAAERGLDQGLIRSLQKLGPEGKIQLAALADASQREIARANEAWRSGRREQQRYTESIEGARGAIARLGKSGNALRSLAQPIGAARADVQRLGGQADTTKAAIEAIGRVHAKPKITVSSNAQQVAAATNAALNSIQDETVIINVKRAGAALGGNLFASGGYTGDIDPSKAVGVVHGREVVIPASVVSRDKSFLLSRYGHLPNMSALRGYASGGFVEADPQFHSNPLNPDFNSILRPGPLQNAIRGLEKDLRALGREVNQSERAMNKQERVLDKATRAYEKQANVVEEWQSKFDDLANSVVGSLTTSLNAGLDAERSPWAGPLDIFGTLMGTLNSDTVRGGAFNQARDAIDDFIEGPALEQLIRELSPEQFIQAAGLSGAQLDQIEAAINLRNSVVGAAGAGAGDAVFGAELRAAKGELVALRSIATEEREEWKAYRDDWRKDKSALRAAELAQRTLERQLEAALREIERHKAERKGARDGRG